MHTSLNICLITCLQCILRNFIAEPKTMHFWNICWCILSNWPSEKLWYFWITLNTPEGIFPYIIKQKVWLFKAIFSESLFSSFINLHFHYFFHYNHNVKANKLIFWFLHLPLVLWLAWIGDWLPYEIWFAKAGEKGSFLLIRFWCSDLTTLSLKGLASLNSYFYSNTK